MATRAEVDAKIDEYVSKFRKIGLAPFERSQRYSLFPAEESPEPKWPGTYPNSERAGVYLMFDEEMVLLYVGKASMGSCIGSRLGSYFAYASDRETCRLKHEWKKGQPRYVITVAVPDDSPFEAPALEEYLIAAFGNTLENKVGTTRK